MNSRLNINFKTPIATEQDLEELKKIHKTVGKCQRCNIPITYYDNKYLDGLCKDCFNLGITGTKS